MTKRNNFTKNLMTWYKKNARDLPWRKTKDPYKIWISEIMLQQTTVNAVIPYYERWIKVFPNVKSVAQAPLQKVLKVWQGLGYYARAKNIHKSAKIICGHYGGKIPADPEELKKLPGFGPYTRGAILSIAFNQRFPIIDANVRRVVMRQLAIDGFADTSHDEKILQFLEKVMPYKNNSIFNQALMELGALVCRSQEVLCNVCPVHMDCLAYQKGIQEIIPQQKKKVIKNINVVVAIIKQNGKYFIQKRPSKGLFADLWEFPGGKIEKGETSKEALRREIKEELNTAVEVAKPLFNLYQFYTQFRAKLHVWDCCLKDSPADGPQRKWVSATEFHKYPMPSGSAKIVDKLAD